MVSRTRSIRWTTLAALSATFLVPVPLLPTPRAEAAENDEHAASETVVFRF